MEDTQEKPPRPRRQMITIRVDDLLYQRLMAHCGRKLKERGKPRRGAVSVNRWLIGLIERELDGNDQ